MHTTPLPPEDVSALGYALLSEVFKLSIPSIRRIVGRAGIDASQIPSRSEAQGGGGSRAEVVPAVQRLFGAMSEDRRIRCLPILADSLMWEYGADSNAARNLECLLGQHGFQYVDGTFVPIKALDERERKFVPGSAFTEITAAFDRLALGDESGAITKACGAVDSTTTAIYEKNRWEHNPSFQAKVNTVFTRLETFERLEADLVSIGICPDDARKIAGEARETSKHAAEALQVIRRAMGDVHGTKPALRKTAYDSIKWASAICGLLEGEV